MTTEQTLQLALESMAKVNESQSRQLEILTEQNAEMAQRIKELTAQIAWFQRQMFGRRSEKRLVLEGQPSLFDDDELIQDRAAAVFPDIQRNAIVKPSCRDTPSEI